MNLNQITVPAYDIDKSIDFYKLLGLQLIVKSHLNYARFVCPDGESSFSLSKVENLNHDCGIHVYFECSNLDERVNKLIEKGVKFIELPNDKTWLWREAHLLDPSQNHIVLYYAGENRLNPPWRLKE